ncbi:MULTISPECIES: MFS transporter [unclassified Caballeronia]|jgi:MFS family permease|uniref:MFS transporter n=1 Tax=unclassified Caballeronia TaxID=2646786 RepID=UPI002027E0F2|nr:MULTISPECIES: MFS transporter [unclassified Caballeronia]MDR5773971.1 MFS transporter [Caballeronia sp. LZ002]MDR5800355.1 MFS transporter [Caballeronia sp. LZ001]MDR5849406.1 MFS transporter [Caballeronia sp. LZ003]
MEALYGDQAVKETDAGRIYGRAYWRLLPLLLICYLVAYLDRVNVGFAKLQMLDALGFDDAIYGLGSGIFFAGYFFFEVPSNLVMRKVGARRWIARIMLTWGVISAAMVLVKTPTMFYIARFMLGAAEAGFAPAIMYLLTLWFPARYRGRAMSIYVMGAPLAFVVGGPISGYILHAFSGNDQLAPWQWLFLIEALPAIVLAFVVLRFLDDDPAKARWLSDDERNLVLADIRAENASKIDYTSVRGFLGNKKLWAFCAIYFCLIMGLYALGFWMPSLVKRSGVADPFAIGLYTAVPNIFAAIALYLSNRSADRTGGRRIHFAAFMVIGAVGLAVSMWLSAGPLVTVACLSVAAAGVYSCIALFWALPTSLFVGASVAAALAFINSVGNIAGFMSPYLVGLLNVWLGHAEVGMYVISAFLVLGACMTMRLPRTLDK